MDENLFEREVTLSGKVIYKHIANGKKRVRLLADCRAGKITPEEMRGHAKALPYLFRKDKLPEQYALFGHCFGFNRNGQADSDAHRAGKQPLFPSKNNHGQTIRIYCEECLRKQGVWVKWLETNTPDFSIKQAKEIDQLLDTP